MESQVGSLAGSGEQEAFCTIEGTSERSQRQLRTSKVTKAIQGQDTGHGKTKVHVSFNTYWQTGDLYRGGKKSVGNRLNRFHIQP